MDAPTPRLAFGGIGTECSTYSRIRTRREDFAILTGDALAAADRFAFLKRYAVPFLPTLAASAVPGGPVVRGDYDALKAEFLDRLRGLLPLDGLFLALHGAMFVDGMHDAEGDWLAATRRAVGPDCLVSVSYDLHGNVSQRVVDQIDLLSAFRTAPHIDREQTMTRACDMLLHCLEHRVRPTLVWAPVPVLVSGERSSTEWEPGRRLYGQLPELDHTPGVMDVSLLVGYVWADEPRSTASVVVTGTDRAAQATVATDLARQYWDARADFQFGTETCSIADGVRRAIAAPTRPAVLADSGDNPTGGGVGDRAEVLAELLRQRAANVVLAGIADRPATDACYAAGVDATLPLSIGATLDPAGSTPVRAIARVRHLLPTTDDRLREAVVQIDGVTLVLAARRRPYHDLADFARFGLDPRAFQVVVVKSGYLSPDLAPLANPSLMALSDGAINQDVLNLPANRHRPPTYPFVPDLRFTPVVYDSARNGGRTGVATSG